ncbi:MAG TPA: hypothetical protein VGX51_14730 [Solirubrobacteraceae bacterium]|nr:hypothetical protein [Solirubrobacteraceae bacterium]
MRAAPIRRHIFVAMLGLLLAAALAAATALGAKPKHGAHFTGHTSVVPVEGFLAPVKFTVSADGRSLSNFTFGTFGCFGAGGFRPGVNPYKGNSLIDAGKIKVAANGHFSQIATSSYTVQGFTLTTTMLIAGSFSTPRKASGTITFSQAESGTYHASCGPAKPTFTASAH